MFGINVGRTDRTIRIVVGAALVALAVTGVVGWWGYLGVIPLVTGLTRRCPAYSMVGTDTLEKR